MDAAQLEEKCAQNIAEATIALRKESFPERFDSSYIKHIHKCMFEKTFEWAGHTRDKPFIFMDGSSAYMPEMSLSENVHYADGKEFRKLFREFDNTLAEKNNLRGLSRTEFIRHAAPLFASLNYIHPFRDGNEHVQRLFFERLSQFAGHELNFSLVTRERMIDACSGAMERNNLTLVRHMFEDISNPHKREILQNFMKHAESFQKEGFDTRNVVVALEDFPVFGVFAGVRDDIVAVSTKDMLVICETKDFDEEQQLKTLSKGDFVSFSSKQSPEILIPEKKMGFLPKNELFQMIEKHILIRESTQLIQRLSQTVYNNPNILDDKLSQINKDQSFAATLSQQIETNPRSIAELAGAKYLFVKNNTRKNAENCALALATVVREHGEIATYVCEQSVENYQQERERKGVSIDVPNARLQNVLSLSKSAKLQKEAFLLDPDLKKEFECYEKALNKRLSRKEHKAIEEKDFLELAKTVGVSIKQAQKIARIVDLTKATQRHVQELDAESSKKLITAVVKQRKRAASF